MATIEQSSVFEFCEKLFDELEARDGGYYPAKHDNFVFSQAASNFSITTESVSQIYQEYSKVAAELEVNEINKLPINIRKKTMMRKMQNILLNNHDLPFFSIEGPPTDEMPSALDILSDEYRALVETIAQGGWTIPLNIDIHRFNELKKTMGDASALDNYFLDFYNGREIRLIFRKIEKAIDNLNQRDIFSECVRAYESNLYSVCITTLITVLEGFVSTFGDDPRDVRIMRICKFHAGEEINKRRNIKSLCWLSMYEFVKNLFAKNDFSKPEPDIVNRHWIQHGRTSHQAEAIDCLRIFNALSTLASIKQYMPLN